MIDEQPTILIWRFGLLAILGPVAKSRAAAWGIHDLSVWVREKWLLSWCAGFLPIDGHQPRRYDRAI